MNDPKTILEPIGGYILDSWSKLRCRFFVPHSLTKLHQLHACKKSSRADTILEVGSYKGVTTHRLSYLFDTVHSIEIDEDLFCQAQDRCKKRKNVKLHLGDGIEVLRTLAPSVQRCVLFLDGHFSGGETGSGEVVEPVLVELDVIGDSLDNFEVIVIDDFRLFGIEPGWPSKAEVLGKLEEVFERDTWSINVQNDQVIVLRK